MLIEILLSFVTAAYGGYKWTTTTALLAYGGYKWITCFNSKDWLYYEKRNIKYVKLGDSIVSFFKLIGNRLTADEFARNSYFTFKDQPIYGILDFGIPKYMVRDPDIIKKMKDFNYFEDPQKWRQWRADLYFFLYHRMPQMHYLVSECAVQVVKHLSDRIDSGEKINLEMKDFFTRYTNDVIASCELSRPENEIYLIAKQLSNFSASFEMVKVFFIMLMPKLARANKTRFADPTSNTLSFAAFELVANPDIQQKLYEEITEKDKQLEGKRIGYDALQEMKYLHQFTFEVLRKWPPFTQTDRLCAKDYEYDDGVRKFVIEKGSNLFIPVYGIQHDPKYYPNPELFDPERFSDENKDQIIPGTYIPFGIDPRNCIGSRFVLMEIKAIIYYLLLNYTFEPNKNTDLPLKLKETHFSPTMKNRMHLELKPRSI